MIDEALRRELLAMESEDLKVRQELLDRDELGPLYNPRMEEVHVRNAARLRDLIAKHGWPAEDIAGADGANAAWRIVQHAIGEPAFMKEGLRLLLECAGTGGVPAWQAAYVEDRIALYEDRPQRFGTQWIDDGVPWTLADPNGVDELRASVGLDAMPPFRDSGPPAEHETARWWRDWLGSKGWRG